MIGRSNETYVAVENGDRGSIALDPTLDQSDTSNRDGRR